MVIIQLKYALTPFPFNLLKAQECFGCGWQFVKPGFTCSISNGNVVRGAVQNLPLDLTFAIDLASEWWVAAAEVGGGR